MCVCFLTTSLLYNTSRMLLSSWQQASSSSCCSKWNFSWSVISGRRISLQSEKEKKNNPHAITSTTMWKIIAPHIRFNNNLHAFRNQNQTFIFTVGWRDQSHTHIHKPPHRKIAQLEIHCSTKSPSGGAGSDPTLKPNLYPNTWPTQYCTTQTHTLHTLPAWDTLHLLDLCLDSAQFCER